MIVRQAEKRDAEGIADCLLLAMEEIVYQFIQKRNRRDAFAFLLTFAEKEANQYSYQNCYVAELDLEIAGTINIYDGDRLYELRAPVLRYIREHYNPGLELEDESFGNE